MAPTGRRRRVDGPDLGAVPTLGVIPVPADAPPLEIAEVHELVPRSHRQGRRKAGRTLTPNGTTLIAGAAAVAVAAVGAVVSTSGAAPAGTNVQMAAASALGVISAPAAQAQAPEAVADPAVAKEREQVRASRERARDALADRARAAAQAQKEAAAAAKAAAKAKAEAARLVELAKSYRLPISGYRLTAFFGQSGGYWSAGHTGLDFAAPYGTAIRAVATGVVTFTGWDGSYGYKTVVRHADGTESWYAHQSRMLVSRGDKVAAGDTIGRVGSTGNSTGNHLHLEVRVNDTPINPLSWLRSKGMRI